MLDGSDWEDVCLQVYYSNLKLESENKSQNLLGGNPRNVCTGCSISLHCLQLRFVPVLIWVCECVCMVVCYS